MSRSNRGPRKDVALLRKVKDPNFSPSSLLEGGDELLSKASQLQGFLTAQKQRTTASSTKTEWLLTQQQLQDEREAAEKELSHCLTSLVAAHGMDIPDLAMCLTDFSVSSERVKAERLEYKTQIKSFASISQSLKAYGRNDFNEDAAVLKDEFAMLKEELNSAIAELAQSVLTVSCEVREAWPTALSAGEPGSAFTLSDADGCLVYDYSQDALALSEMVTRYTLASPGITDRIWEVFSALQEKCMERMDTWRMEVDVAAAVHSDALAAHAARAASHAAASTSRSTGSSTSGTGGFRGSSPLKSPHLAKGSPPASNSGRSAMKPTSLTADPPRLPAPGLAKRVSGSGAGPGSSPAAAAGGGGGSASYSSSGPDPRSEAVSSTGPGLLHGPGGSFSSSSSSCGPRVAASFLLSGCGAWPADEHSMFIKLRERFYKELGARGGREAVMTKVAALLPGRTLADAMLHDDWLLCSRLLLRRRRDLIEAWKREVRTFVEDSGALLAESATRAAARAETAANKLAHELVRERLHDELDDLRAVKAEEDALLAAARADAEAAAAARAAEEASARRAAHEVRKALVAEYRREVERKAALAAAAAGEAARLAAAEAAERSVFNRERTEWRAAEYLVKVDAHKAKDAEAAAEVAARAERLARLRALVAPDVESDPARLMAPTAAVTAALEVFEAERIARERGQHAGPFNSVHGYTTEQVARDQRFKIMEALSRQGLQNTDYGRKVIAMAAPATNTRRDNMTTEQRGAVR